MEHTAIISELEQNTELFKCHLLGISEAQASWKESDAKWSLLEIICHMTDEEIKDFRARTQLLLETPNQSFVPIDPPAWVEEHTYMKQDFQEAVKRFVSERQKSITWLKSLKDPNWLSSKEHQYFGKMTAQLFLANWLAHDLVHLQQISRTKIAYLKAHCDESLNYATGD